MAHALLALSTGRPAAPQARRVVVKLGTAVLAGAGGAARGDRVRALVASVAALRRAGREVLVVASGAVRTGAERLGIAGGPAGSAAARACAAVGQARLMAGWTEACERAGVVAAQLLVTGEDFAQPGRLASLRAALGILLEQGVLPVLNENDVVATSLADAGERGTGLRDNDRLAALVAVGVRADLLLILTDVPGLLTADPHGPRPGRLIPVVKRLTPRLERAAGGPRVGRGGMRSKLEAARLATRAGCAVVVADGREDRVVERVCAGEAVGTLFVPRPPGRSPDA
ncbi:MAG TPA: glutamate 5-kinase [Gemmatimonadales bacterium]|nr:glutamate 5-kinase [Gemmatimonadales bacterium]